MKNKLTGLLIGIIIGCFCTLGTIYADNLDVLLNSVKININGATLLNSNENYTLADGSEVPSSLIYGGTTYLPIRKLSELLGREIAWDGDTRTIDINEKADTSWEYIKNKNELIVGIDDSYIPMSYIDENGNYAGFDVDFAKSVAEHLGINIKFQPIDWAAKELELASKNIDCIWSGMSVTSERLENLSATEPYIDNEVVFMGIDADKVKSFSDLKNKKIGVLEYSTGIYLAEEHPEYNIIEQNISTFDSNEHLKEALKSGEIDLILMDEISGFYILKGYDIKVSEISLGTDSYAVFFRNNEQELADLIDSTIKQHILSGKVKEISEKWFFMDLTQ